MNENAKKTKYLENNNSDRQESKSPEIRDHTSTHNNCSNLVSVRKVKFVGAAEVNFPHHQTPTTSSMFPSCRQE